MDRWFRGGKNIKNKLCLNTGKWMPSGDKAISKPKRLIATRDTGKRIGEGKKFIYIGEKEDSGHYIYSLSTGRINKINDRSFFNLKLNTRAISNSRPNKKEKVDIDKLMLYISWYGKTVEVTDMMGEYLKHDLKWFEDDKGYKEQIHLGDKIIYGLINNEDTLHKLRKRFGEDLIIKAIGEDIYLFNLNKKTTENKIGLALLDIGFINNLRGKNILKDKKNKLSYYISI